jgi:diaminopimelate epimerase
MTLRLSKHHGLGNDFLVLIGSADQVARVDADLAARLCDRHRGVGADGLLVGVLPADDTVTDGPDLTMTLYNADGGIAEMSGNGIRCLAQAEARRRGTDTVDLRIATDGGSRPVQVRPGPDPATVLVRVEMGAAGPGPEADWQPAEPPAVAPQKQATVDLGNPHLVLLVDDPAAVPLDQDGPLHESCYDAGINVHVAARSPGGAATDEVTMRTWERGVGLTEACGTGATAVARALHDWGVIGDEVTVHMPGGDVVVQVGDSMVLTGPAAYVADVEVTA